MPGRLLLALLALLLSCCAGPPAENTNHSYRDDLADTIRRSQIIRLVEHSHPDDGDGPNEWRRLEKNPRIYRQADLSPEAAMEFEQRIRSLPSDGEDARTRCLFVNHHSIHFIRNGKITSNLRVCFQCGDIIWDDSDRLPPRKLLHCISDVLSSHGLQPERNWKALAR